MTIKEQCHKIFGTKREIMRMQAEYRHQKEVLLHQALKEGRTDLFSLNFRAVYREYKDQEGRK